MNLLIIFNLFFAHFFPLIFLAKNIVNKKRRWRKAEWSALTQRKCFLSCHFMVECLAFENLSYDLVNAFFCPQLNLFQPPQTYPRYFFWCDIVEDTACNFYGEINQVQKSAIMINIQLCFCAQTSSFCDIFHHLIYRGEIFPTNCVSTSLDAQFPAMCLRSKHIILWKRPDWDIYCMKILTKNDFLLFFREDNFHRK